MTDASPIIATPTRKVFINRADLGSSAEQLTALSACLLDAAGGICGTPRRMSLEASHKAAERLILGFLGAVAGAEIDVTDKEHPAALRRRGVL